MNPIAFLVHNLMLPVLAQSYALTGSYGWAIVVLTLGIKLLLLPLAARSYFSSVEMQQLQPKLKKLQEQYRDDPQELQRQMMLLLREHKVNPLGGCLPLLLQLPFLIALYDALVGQDFKNMLMATGVDKSFYLLPDLTHVGLWANGAMHLENLALLAIFTLTTVWQQQLMMPPMDADADPRQVAMQKQMQVMMPIMITVMFLLIPLPTGVYLYLVVSNLIGIAQYAVLKRIGAQKSPASPTG